MASAKSSQLTARRTTREGPPVIDDLEPLRIPASAGTLSGFVDWYQEMGRPAGYRLSFLRDNIFVDCEMQGIGISIPISATTLEGFCTWATSDDFPRSGRIAFLNQEIFFDMSPEEIETHLKVKSAVNAGIEVLNEELDQGEFFPDGALVVNQQADCSQEPDATFVKWRTYSSGKVRLVPRKDRPGHYMQIVGSPDWVMEVVSQTTVRKDTVDLPVLYHRARISEYWLIDARGEDIDFRILVYRKSGYVRVPYRDGWHKSRVFGRSFRLERRRNRMGRWTYKLLVRPA